jgi:hypothetical protein
MINGYYIMKEQPAPDLASMQMKLSDATLATVIIQDETTIQRHNWFNILRLSFYASQPCQGTKTLPKNAIGHSTTRPHHNLT